MHPGKFVGTARLRRRRNVPADVYGKPGFVNGVTPAFTNLALGDEWRPNDKLDINVALKYANDNFYLQNTNDPGKNFWFAAAQQEFCYNPLTDQPVLIPQPPQDASVVEPYVSFTCPVDKSSGTPVQTVHPDGKDGHLLLSNNYPLTFVQNYWQPRIGLRSPRIPDTVFRISAGRYAQEPQNYEIQYNSFEANLAEELARFPAVRLHDAVPRRASRSFRITTTSRSSATLKVRTCR